MGSSRSRRNKKTKSKDSRDLESIRSQLKTQNSFNETKFKEMESFVEQTKQTTKRVLENQLKPNKEKLVLESSLLKIESTLTTIVNSSNAHQESIKGIEDAMASNAKKEKEKNEKERKKDLRTLKYFGTFEERLSSVEKALQSQQVCQNHVENTIPPNQTNTKVSQDFIAVQKTEDKETESSTEQQSEIVPEASCGPAM